MQIQSTKIITKTLLSCWVMICSGIFVIQLFSETLLQSAAPASLPNQSWVSLNFWLSYWRDRMYWICSEFTNADRLIWKDRLQTCIMATV